MSDHAGGRELKYGIIGEDTASELEKLEKYSGEVSWDYLEKHFQSGALLYIDPSLDVIVVGKAFADDNATLITEWRKTGDIVQPSAPHALYWRESKLRFKALVVSPFVLIQPIENS